MHPILFRVGPVVVGSYGLFVLLGLVAGWLLIPRYARRVGIDPDTGRQVLVLVFIAGWFGCRLLNVVLRFDEVLDDPRVTLWIFRQAGVWYGALIAGGLTCVILAWRKGLNGWAVLDMATIPAAVGGAIGRIGCLLSGCCYGKPCRLPWAISYTNPIAHQLHLSLPYGPLHPAVLYEAAGVLILVGFLDRYTAAPRRPGQVVLSWIVLYGLLRSIVEVFRGDGVRGTLIGPLSTSQSISLVLALCAGGCLIVRARKKEA